MFSVVQAGKFHSFVAIYAQVTSPQYILDRLTGAYGHKNFRVREEILLLMQDTVMR